MRGTRARRTAAVLVVLGLAAAMAACGSDSGGQLAAGGPKVETLSAAAARTDSLDTATWKLVATDSSVDGSTWTITGSVDRSRHLAETTAAESPQSGQTSSDGMALVGREVIVEGDTVYLHVGELAGLVHASTPWVSGDTAGWRSSVFSTMLLSQDPFSIYSSTGDAFDGTMAFLRTISAGVTKVGTETVDGVSTTHYHADVDLEAVENELRHQLAETLGTALGDDGMTVGTTTGTLSVDVWIDGNGLIHRCVASGPSGDSSTASGGGTTSVARSGGTFTLAFDLLTTGQPVHIVVPPADQVTKVDLSKLGGLTQVSPDTTSPLGSTTTATG